MPRVRKPKPAAAPKPQAAPPGHWRWRAALAALALLAYANSFGLGLARDGKILTTADPRVRSLTAENLGLIVNDDYWWPSSVGQVYRPIATASFLLNNTILGGADNPAGFHVVNWLLHLGNVWLVFELALCVLGGPVPAFFAAAIWAVHPLGTEAVTNVAGRADLFAAMAVLGGLWLYIRENAAPARRRFAAAGGLFAITAAGLLSKENAVALVALVPLWDISFIDRPWSSVRRRFPFYVALAAALALFAWARHRVFSAAPWPELPFVDNPLQGAPFWTARLTAIEIVGRYLSLLVWPLRLASDRAYNDIPLAHVTDLLPWLALLLITAILAVAFIRYRKDRLLFWTIGFFGITLLPTSNLILIIGSNMAERFLYLPSVAFAIAAVALMHRLPQKRLPIVLLCAGITLFAGRTLARNTDWNSDLTLAEADVRAAPGSFRTHDNLATSLYAQAPQRNLDRVIEESEKAWAILTPLPAVEMYQQTPANLGLYYRVKGDVAGGPKTAEGRAWYEKSLAVLLRARDASRAHEKAYDQGQLAHGLPLATRVAYQPLYFYLAATDTGLQRYPEALDAYRYARVLNPAVPRSYDGIAEVSLAAGDPTSAAVALDEKALALGLAPDTTAALKTVYTRIPGGACALGEENGALKLNLACPALHEHLCRAWNELAAVFAEARLPQPARSFREASAQQGCGAASAQ